MNEQRTVANRAIEGASKQTLDSLVLDLKAFSHGAWAQMILNRLALFGRNLGEAHSGAANERLRKAVAEYRESVHPLIVHVADRLRSLGIDTKIVQDMRFHSDELAALTGRLIEGPNPSAEQLQKCERGIPEHVDRLLVGFRMVREHVMAEFRCEANGALRRVLEQWQAEDRRLKVVFPNDLSAHRHLVVMAEADLFRVLDILLGWAAARGEGELSFRVRTDQASWMLEMRHDGLYIPPDRWGKVFTGDAPLASVDLSTVPEILSKYDADICVKSSSKDSGTALLVRLRLLPG